MRFVAVSQPRRGTILLMTTDLPLPPLDVIKLYGLRFTIEVSFKQALHVVGTYTYRFWMAAMTPLRRVSGNQYLHRQSSSYRRKVLRKLSAYHTHIQLGVIAQGTDAAPGCGRPQIGLGLFWLMDENHSAGHSAIRTGLRVGAQKWSP